MTKRMIYVGFPKNDYPIHGDSPSKLGRAFSLSVEKNGQREIVLSPFVSEIFPNQKLTPYPEDFFLSKVELGILVP